MATAVVKRKTTTESEDSAVKKRRQTKMGAAAVRPKTTTESEDSAMKNRKRTKMATAAVKPKKRAARGDCSLVSREGRLRPRKQSCQDQLQPVQYPDTWTWEKMHSNPVLGVELDLDLEEAQQITGWVCSKTPVAQLPGPQLTVRRILRVQNMALWDRYYRQKQEMQKRYGETEVTERRLYHGTAPENIDSICVHGFLTDQPVVHGDRLGKGIYFAEKSNHAHWYTGVRYDSPVPKIWLSTEESEAKEEKSAAAAAAALKRGPGHYLLLCTVLTGRSYHVGLPAVWSHQSPPPISESFDSRCCVKKFGKEYMVFESSQAYPKYIIEYGVVSF